MMNIQEQIQKSAFFKKTHIRLGISISIIMGVITLVFMLFTFTSRSLFSKNKHFIIKNIVIQGSAVWETREQQILSYGGIVRNQTNLFEINPRSLREKIEALPSVEKSTISRKLPHTLIIKISERIPRIAFRTGGKLWYADEKGVVFSASSYGVIRRDLPFVVGFSLPQGVVEGETITEFRFPAQLATHCERYYPEFTISKFEIRAEDFVIGKIRYIEKDESYTVIFPQEKLEEKFAAFKWALMRSIQENTGKKTFDLRFENQVVTR